MFLRFCFYENKEAEAVLDLLRKGLLPIDEAIRTFIKEFDELAKSKTVNKEAWKNIADSINNNIKEAKEYVQLLLEVQYEARNS